MKRKQVELQETTSEAKINMKFHILAIIAIVLFSFALTPKTLQNDTYYTIKIGELILEKRN